MVSKNQIKHITALHQKKHRQSEGLFIAEGVKVISELLRAGFICENLFATDSSFDDNPQKILISEADLKKMSALTSANNSLAVFRMREPSRPDMSGIIVALDDIRDPGNLGTIIRLCDWFGITELVCSPNTAELYNPKVVQATMGSIARVNVNYLDLENFLNCSRVPIFGTFMEGANIYAETLPENAVIVLGNEANGISKSVEKLVSKKLSIPRFGKLQQTESLNVATATAIILSEFRRNS